MDQIFPLQLTLIALLSQVMHSTMPCTSVIVAKHATMFTPMLLIVALSLIQLARMDNSLHTDLWPWWSAIATVVLLLLVWISACYARRHNHRKLAILSDRFSHIAALIIFIVWIYSSDWVQPSSSSLYLIAPLLIGQYLLWLFTAQAHGANNFQQACSMANIRLRFETLPMIVLILILDLSDLVISHDFITQFGDSALLIEIVLSIFIMIFALSILPIILLKLWGCTPVAGTTIEPVLNAACHDAQVRVAYLQQWPQRAYPFYNAMAMGFLPRWRVVIISEDLADILNEQELRAVIGHELGHLKHKHLFIYLSFIITLSIWCGLCAFWLHPLYEDLFAVFGLMGEHAIAVCNIILLLCGLRYAFGFLSRACERQADLHGANLANTESMCSALLKVSQATGQDPATANWRHHSIAQRIDYLQKNEHSVCDPRSYGLHIMKLSTVIIIALLIALTFSMIQQTRSVSLEKMRTDNPQLNRAISAAAANNPEPLYKWLAQRGNFKRNHYLKAVRSSLLVEDEKEEQKFIEEPHRVYLNKHLYIPFINLQLGTSELDIRCDNEIAYALVAGTRDPQNDDIKNVKIVLPRLVKYVQATPDPGISDTIGCIYFVIGDYQKAVSTFQDVINQLEKTKSDSKVYAQFLSIARKRLQAAQDKSTQLPLEWTEKKDPQESVTEPIAESTTESATEQTTKEE